MRPMMVLRSDIHLQGKLSNGQEKIDDPHTGEGWGVQWLVGVYVLSREGQT
jgi:hypothetical protein